MGRYKSSPSDLLPQLYTTIHYRQVVDISKAQDVRLTPNSVKLTR